jgi:glutathione reductase (NADPH)
MEQYDLVVVGTGAAGSGVATRCAKHGWRVAIVDDQPYGGTCALRGCDPKRVLVGVAELVDWQRRMSDRGASGSVIVDWAAAMEFKKSFTDPVPAKQEAGFKDLGITTFHGSGRFLSADRFSVEGTELTARFFVIASGAQPARLGIPGEEHVKTSTDFLELDALPKRIGFIGAGYIAFEFAHLVATAGAKAFVLGRGGALKQFDADLVNRLVDHCRSSGIDVRPDAPVESVEYAGGEMRLNFRGERGDESIVTDLVIHGAGRVPKTADLDLARAGLETDKRGAVVVNEWLQSTTNPRVYAAGDAVSSPGALPLTPVAAHQGVVVASNLLKGNSRTPDYVGIPSVVFTNPPLAGVGLTEAQAREQGIKTRVKSEDTRNWFANRRVSERAAAYKTIVEEGTDRVIGAHLLGPRADEVINIFALAVRHGITRGELLRMIFSYPTNISDVPYML